MFCIWNIITGLYWVAHQCGHSPAPVPKLKRDKRKLNYKPTQIAPLIDEYTTGIWTRPTLVLDDDSPLLTPKEVFQPTKQHYERFNLYINFQTKSGHLTDPVGEAIDLFERMLDKTALVWFQTNRSKFKDLTTLKTMFLQRYNPWGKTKREQLQSWNILSFDPKNTDVDEHIDLINTLGDMVDQKEEAKIEKFIETMPTMIQTHLITCKDWAAVKDTVKSLEHIIQK